MGIVQIQESYCKVCRLCISACPKGVLQVEERINALGYYVIGVGSEECVACGRCAVSCPEGAIEVYR